MFLAVLFRDMPPSFSLPWGAAAGHTSGAAGSRALGAGPSPGVCRPSGSPGAAPLARRVVLSPARGRVAGPSVPFLVWRRLQAPWRPPARGETLSRCVGCLQQTLSKGRGEAAFGTVNGNATFAVR